MWGRADYGQLGLPPGEGEEMVIGGDVKEEEIQTQEKWRRV